MSRLKSSPAPGRTEARSPLAGRTRLAADIGGTFTDVAAFDEACGRLLLGKALSTPGHLVDGISHGVDKAGTHFEEHASTAVLLPGDRLDVDAFGNLIIAIGRKLK